MSMATPNDDTASADCSPDSAILKFLFFHRKYDNNAGSINFAEKGAE
jgi:hypothetical protein